MHIEYMSFAIVSEYKITINDFLSHFEITSFKFISDTIYQSNIFSAKSKRFFTLIESVVPLPIQFWNVSFSNS